MSAAIAENLDEIDEALTYAQAVPQDQRGAAWYAYTDRLLEMRSTATNTGATASGPHKTRA
jgi:hypothetical protein